MLNEATDGRRQRGLEIAAPPRRVGSGGDHLQLLVRQGAGSAARPLKCIAFGSGTLFDRLPVGTIIDLAVEPSINEYNGYRNVELEVKDVQFPGGAEDGAPVSSV